MNPSTPRRRRLVAAATFVAAVLSFAACGDSKPSRADVIGDATTEVVPARYADAADAATEVIVAVDDWCAGADPVVVVDAVEVARGAWVALEPYSFGPASDRRSMFIIDPRFRAADVDALGEAEQPVDAFSLRELAGADQRGWGAVEHLATGDATERRCAYARAAAELSAEELAALAEDWTTYGPELATLDAADVALRNIVSESLFAVRMVIDGSDVALDEHRLRGVRLALIGDGADQANQGIAPLLSDGLVERLTAELDADNAMSVQITISTDIVGELGSTVNFSDADGDG